ncbi:2-polyprenyl-6-methoxyphenol hydroxylase-like FAD-dependent oxidoreductase [Variovorax boronicumulans]|uniref:FAD-dependent oxidoreductase n=1 Tax=Variovorax boronicumulans TaxID=436515 RepID=UPI002788F808|nr:FAD-dependent oxidoreductase [Variovorax boronicumulans]MDP9910584.1 2-polyprenyl-6-methoxyphenol hydroxylase-like FAD-dependent oxidoreductase [Variovorax boronicumulans]
MDTHTTSAPAPTTSPRCCIAGGGPAGMVLGLLLARAGVPVVVLEKHLDFLRDFRGDTVHPSTLEVLHELGLLDAFLQRPHNRIEELRGTYEGRGVTIADFRRLPTHARFLVLMPQWEFLDFMCDEARRYPGFELWTDAEAVGLLQDKGRVNGVKVRVGARSPDSGGPKDIELHASLIVAADGRHSTLRDAAALPHISYGAPIDVLWMRLPKLPGDPEATGGHIAAGHLLVTLNRGDYWQCAFVIRKGGSAELQSRGIAAFHAEIARIAPFFATRLPEALPDWEAVKLLEVSVDRLESWSCPGLLCIGDAAHAMSPVGGVGINLAVQDAVAAANLLAASLVGSATDKEIDNLLPQLQRRREWPVRVTQAAQRLVQDRVLMPVLSRKAATAAVASTAPRPMPWPLRLLGRWPWLRTLPARAVGIGVRAEHVQSPRA